MVPLVVELIAGVVVVVVAIAVAVKVIVSDPLVAVSVFDPAVEPRVQLFSVAIPFEPVVADETEIEPLPEFTAKLTIAPFTGLLYTSLIMTLGGTVTAVLTDAD